MQTNEVTPRKPLRLWPGVVAALLLVAFKFVMPLFGTAGTPTMFLGGLAGGALIILWWLFLSRAPWMDGLGAILVDDPRDRRDTAVSGPVDRKGGARAALLHPWLSRSSPSRWWPPRSCRADSAPAPGAP